MIDLVLNMIWNFEISEHEFEISEHEFENLMDILGLLNYYNITAFISRRMCILKEEEENEN